MKKTNPLSQCKRRRWQYETPINADDAEITSSGAVEFDRVYPAQGCSQMSYYLKYRGNMIKVRGTIDDALQLLRILGEGEVQVL